MLDLLVWFSPKNDNNLVCKHAKTGWGSCWIVSKQNLSVDVVPVKHTNGCKHYQHRFSMLSPESTVELGMVHFLTLETKVRWSSPWVHALFNICLRNMPSFGPFFLFLGPWPFKLCASKALEHHHNAWADLWGLWNGAKMGQLDLARKILHFLILTPALMARENWLT